MYEAFLTILGTATIGAFAWLFQLGNRVTKTEVRLESLPELLKSHFDSIDSRLERIERSMNGHFHRD